MALNSLIKDRFQYALIHCMYSCEVAIDAGKALQGEDSINVGLVLHLVDKLLLLPFYGWRVFRCFEYISALNSNTFVIILAYTNVKTIQISMWIYKFIENIIIVEGLINSCSVYIRT